MTSNRSLAMAVTLLLLSMWAPAHGQETGGAAGDGGSVTEPWIDALDIYLAPTMARLYGAGYEPGVLLWLDITDPLGSVSTTRVAADADGRLIADVAVDEPGVHKTLIRDDAGRVLSTGELFVGLQ